MTALIGELTKRLPDRWLGLTLGPGLLWLALAWLALRLGHGRPFARDPVVAEAQRLARLVREAPVTAVLLGLGLLALAVLVSLVARWLGSAVRVLWLGRWAGPLRRPAGLLAARRRKRALTRLTRAGDRLPTRYLPASPTWIGDRLRLADVRVDAQYGLSLALVWPRLWQLVAPETRLLLQDARGRFDRTAVLAGWALCYAGLAALWWPAAVIGVAVLVAAWWRGRVAAALFADAIEATVDLHHRLLAESLGHVVDPGKSLPPDVADAINDQLHKGATPQPRAERDG